MANNHRLMITKMVLENFKSYAGVQEVGPFHKRFSSVVGPNGSGKSNVIDALLFVFGKRAKQLRLNKVSELIHKSASHSGLEYAKVSVYFQLIIDDENSDDEFSVIPESEFIVSRQAFQNNQSKYTIDGKTSNYTDVGQLLRKHGVDLDNNRFLILQGEVEQIAMMKPKAENPNDDGLLEYLEDIIGTNKYVKDIEETAKLVEDLNEERLKHVWNVKLAEKEREKLQQPREEAEKFLAIEREIRCKQSLFYQLQHTVATTNVLGGKTKLTGYMEKLAIEREKIKKEESELKDMEHNYQSVRTEYDRIVAESERAAKVTLSIPKIVIALNHLGPPSTYTGRPILPTLGGQTERRSLSCGVTSH